MKLDRHGAPVGEHESGLLFEVRLERTLRLFDENALVFVEQVLRQARAVAFGDGERVQRSAAFLRGGQRRAQGQPRKIRIVDADDDDLK